MENLHKKVVGCGLTVACTISAVTNMAACARSIPAPEEEKKKEEPVIQAGKENTSVEEEEESVLLAKELDSSYPNRAVRALESVRMQLGEDEYLEKIAELGSAEKSKSRGEYVGKLLSSVTDSDGEEAAKKVMRACGYQCLNSNIFNGMKKYYEKEKSLDAVVKYMNDCKIGGGNTIRDGNTITASYDHCYCDIDHKDKLPGCYCQCSCGWFEKLFSTVLDQPVEVTLTDSIINGADKCSFVITLSEEVD